MEEFAPYLPPVFVIALIAYLLWPSRRQTLVEIFPVQTRRAIVAQKHHDIDPGYGADESGFGAVSYYRATFEIPETREQVTFSLDLDQFAFLDQGVSGNLTSQGTKFLAFEADVPSKNPNAQESYAADVSTDIKVLCEECGKSCVFPVTKLGTVQPCAHCRANVDVESGFSRS